MRKPRGPKRWWHFVLPRQFYFVYVLGSGPPFKKHKSEAMADREALRLSLEIGLPVYVLKATSVFLPQQRPPAPRVTKVDLDSENEIDWFNDVIDLKPTSVEYHP